MTTATKKTNNVNRVSHTRAIDGHRWELTQWVRSYEDLTPVYLAHAQVRCTRENKAGNEVAYYRYVGPKAEFDTPEDRQRFLDKMPAKDWAA